MAARKKLEGQKINAVIVVRVTEEMKASVDKMAAESGVATSERVRNFLAREVVEWKAGVCAKSKC